MWSSNPSPRHIYAGENSNLKRYMRLDVHGSSAHDSPDTEATWGSTDRGAGKEGVTQMRVCACAHDGTSFSRKKEWNKAAAATWMDLEIIIWSEVSQRETNITRYHLDVESEKVTSMNLITKQKQTHRHRKHTYSYQRGKRRRGNLGVWD